MFGKHRSLEDINRIKHNQIKILSILVNIESNQWLLFNSSEKVPRLKKL